MKITNFLAIGLLLIGLASCEKNNDSDSPNSKIETSPSAVAATNNSSAGVYKGVLVGSSGFFKISIQNGSDTTFCEFNFDGITANLSSTYFSNWTPGQPIVNAAFTGTWNGQAVSITFSCDANGGNIVLDAVVPGHTVNATVIKETSTVLVKCYEGTYVTNFSTGPINGTWNFVAVGNTVTGWHHDSNGSGGITGTILGTTLTISDPPGATLTITDTSVSGSFHSDSNIITTVTGHRSL